ncbi:hypothetical protein D3C72_2189660 [compost metagenome]
MSAQKSAITSGGMSQMREALRRHSSPMRSVQTGRNTPASARRSSSRRRMPDMRTQASRTIKGGEAEGAVKVETSIRRGASRKA